MGSLQWKRRKESRRSWFRKRHKPKMAKRRGKIRTSERNGCESFYLSVEQYTAVAVEPILAGVRHGCLSRCLSHFVQETRGIKAHRNALVDERR